MTVIITPLIITLRLSRTVLVRSGPITIDSKNIRGIVRIVTNIAQNCMGTNSTTMSVGILMTKIKSVLTIITSLYHPQCT